MKRTITTLTTSGYAIIMFVGALLLLGALYVVNYKYAPASTMITSNRIMSCMDERGMLSFIINYHPQDLVRKNWFDEQNPLVLSSQDNNSKNYVIKYSAAYDVSTDRGVVVAYFTILQSSLSGKFYLTWKSRAEVLRVIHNTLSPNNKNSYELICFPVTVKDSSEIFERAKIYIYDSLKGVK